MRDFPGERRDLRRSGRDGTCQRERFPQLAHRRLDGFGATGAQLVRAPAPVRAERLDQAPLLQAADRAIQRSRAQADAGERTALYRKTYYVDVRNVRRQRTASHAIPTTIAATMM